MYISAYGYREPVPNVRAHSPKDTRSAQTLWLRHQLSSETIAAVRDAPSSLHAAQCRVYSKDLELAAYSAAAIVRRLPALHGQNKQEAHAMIAHARNDTRMMKSFMYHLLELNGRGHQRSMQVGLLYVVQHFRSHITHFAPSELAAKADRIHAQLPQLRHADPMLKAELQLLARGCNFLGRPKSDGEMRRL